MMTLLTEGGAAGHLSHPFEDADLTFTDLKEMIHRGLIGGLDKEGPVTEKLDGQNIAFSVRDGKIVFARNKGHVQNGGKKALDRDGIAKQFKGRGGIEKAFNGAAEDLDAAVQKLSPEQRKKMFGNGSKFMSLEIILPDTQNVIPYGKSVLVMHGTISYDKSGNETGRNSKDGTDFAEAVKKVGADRQKTFGIAGANTIAFSSENEKENRKLAKQYTDELDKSAKEFGLSDKSTLADYRKKWWEREVDTEAKKAGVTLSKQERAGLVKRWADGDKGFGSKNFQDEKKKKWFKDYEDKKLVPAQKRMIKPVESTFLRVGAQTLRRVTNFTSANNPEATKQLKKDVATAIKAVKDSKDPAKLAKLQTELERLSDIGMDNVVPSEGVVFMYNGKPYKFTGAFAPINQINGTFKFDKPAEAKKPESKPKEKYEKETKQDEKKKAEGKPKRTVAIFAGRFQPFHAGHYSVYKNLCDRFGKDNVYIASSDVTDEVRSPFTFKDKHEIITGMFDVPKDHVVQVKNPYRPTEILDKVGKDTTYVTAVSQKDAERLDKGGKYFKNYDKTEKGTHKGFEDEGYYIVAPEMKLTVNGGNISGTQLRATFGNPLLSDSEKKNIFGQVYGKFDKKTYDKIVKTTTKAEKAKAEQEANIKSKGKEDKKSAKGKEADKKKDDKKDKSTNKKGKESRKSKIKKALSTKIKNPQTGNEILIRTALGYKKGSQVRKAAEDQLKKIMKNENFSGGVGVGLTLPGGYINGAPTPKNVKKMRKKIKKSSISEELINEMKSEAIFNKWVEEYFGKQYSNDLLNEAEPPKAGGEESEAQRLGLVHKGRGYYAKDKTSPATHKSEDGKIRPLTPDEIEAEKAKETGAQPAGKPGEKEKEKGEPEAEKKPEKSPEEKEKEKSQTLSGKADLATDAEKRKEKDAEPGTEDSAETPAISPSQAKANEDTPSENLTDEEATAQLAHEKHDLSHDEQQAYEFLDGVPDEEKAAAIDEALNNRSWWQKFSQDTMVGGFLAKKGQQFADTGRGIRSAAKSIASGRGPSLGITKDCSGAPPGPHAPGQGARAPKKSEPPVNMTGGLTELHEVSITLFELEKIAEAIERTNHLKKMGLEEDAASRQKYLKSLGKDGKPKQDEPKDDSKCKDVHYTDYQKRDENGKRMVEKKPVYKKGKKPDLGAGTDDDNLTALKGKAIGFTRSDIDPESGYFKKDDKYYDAEGSEVDKEGNALDKDGKPQQKKNWLGRPVTEEVPVWDDNLTPEQKHAAEHSHHQSHEEGHALKHTAIEATVIAASVMAGPTLAAWGGAKVAASSGASHGVLEVAAHVAAHTAKDVAKHSVLDIMGASNALGAGAIGAGLTVATAGILESLISLNESNDPNKNKEFMTKLVRLTLERMKTYKMTPQQKLQSLRDYKKKNKLKKIKQNTEKRNDLLNTLNETALTYSKAKTIKDFVDFATRRLNLKETPKIKLLNNTKMAEQASTLGGFNPSTKEIVVQTKNRLGADILRTLAHEMVHLKQDELGLIRNPEKDGETGSPIENKANSIAGILLREYGRNNKTIYLESINSFKKKVDEVETIENEDINIPVDKGDDVLVGKFKNKRITIKNIGKDDHGMPTINGRPAATFRIAKEKIEESSTLTASTGLTDDNDGQWLQRGRKRVLNAGDGANKKDPWFQNGGWIQTDFPEADNIFASDEEMMSYKTASYDVDRVLRQPKKLQTDFEKDKHKDKIEIKETSDPYDAYSKKILDMLKQ